MTHRHPLQPMGNLICKNARKKHIAMKKTLETSGPHRCSDQHTILNLSQWGRIQAITKPVRPEIIDKEPAHRGHGEILKLKLLTRQYRLILEWQQNWIGPFTICLDWLRDIAYISFRSFLEVFECFANNSMWRKEWTYTKVSKQELKTMSSFWAEQWARLHIIYHQSIVRSIYSSLNGSFLRACRSMRESLS